MSSSRYTRVDIVPDQLSQRGLGLHHAVPDLLAVDASASLPIRPSLTAFGRVKPLLHQTEIVSAAEFCLLVFREELVPALVLDHLLDRHDVVDTRFNCFQAGHLVQPP